jgi:hypothetical protein
MLAANTYNICTQIEKWDFPNKDCDVPGIDIVAAYSSDIKSAHGFVALDHPRNAIVVAFQGTVDRVDWITDLTTWLRYGYEVSNCTSSYARCLLSIELIFT